MNLSKVRIAKRQTESKKQPMLLRLLAFATAIAAGGLFILAIGENPFKVYAKIITGSLGSPQNIRATAIQFVPLLITSLSLTLAFKMKFWNIGANGQILVGGVFASFFAIYCYGIPHVPLIIIMFAAGALGGGLYALIPAIFKVKFGANEVLLTLMMNYIAFYFISYLQTGPWTSGGHNSIAQFNANTRLNALGGVHVGWVFAVLLVFIIYFYLNGTKQGYEISVVGESRATAEYAGISVSRVVLRTMFLSGALCGAAGMIQVTGVGFTLSPNTAGDVGFTAITVAWLGQLNPFAISLITALFSILRRGSTSLQAAMKLSPYIADVLQSIVLFTFLTFEFFIRYSVVFNKQSRKPRTIS
ncbi:MAG: ABC transporter permease [Oscillospiraceae bacterium]|nr:ABC transporter permease [Oscillospiraceae bacterium]